MIEHDRRFYCTACGTRRFDPFGACSECGSALYTVTDQLRIAR